MKFQKVPCPCTIKHFPTILLGKQKWIFSDSVASLWLIFFSCFFFISLAKVQLKKHHVEPEALWFCDLLLWPRGMTSAQGLKLLGKLSHCIKFRSSVPWTDATWLYPEEWPQASSTFSYSVKVFVQRLEYQNVALFSWTHQHNRVMTISSFNISFLASHKH